MLAGRTKDGQGSERVSSESRDLFGDYEMDLMIELCLYILRWSARPFLLKPMPEQGIHLSVQDDSIMAAFRRMDFARSQKHCFKEAR